MDDGVKEEVGFAVSCVADKFWSRKSKCHKAASKNNPKNNFRFNFCSVFGAVPN